GGGGGGRWGVCGGEGGRERRDGLVGGAGGLDGQRGGPVRRQRELHRLCSVVDPVDVGRVDSGNGRSTSQLLAEQDDPLIPERQVRQHGRHCPASWHRPTPRRIVELADEGFEPATFAIVLGYVGAIGHECLLILRSSSRPLKRATIAR